jgi:hypothetical protein
MTIRQDLHVRQGETFSYTYNWAGKDLTGYTGAMAIRWQLEAPLEAYLSTGNDASGGTITVDSSGNIVLAMTDASTSALAGWLWKLYWLEMLGQEVDSKDRRYVKFFFKKQVEAMYDLRLTSPAGITTRVLEGNVIIHREVTTGTV